MAATIGSTPQSIMVSLAAAIRRALPRSRAIAAAALLMAIAWLSLSDKQASAADVPAATRSWVVQELKGAAFSRPRAGDDSQWQSLQAGARIEPGSVVRTDDSGRVELTNGIDQIRLSPSSEIELPMQQNGDPVTRVIHWIGTAFFHVGKRPGPQFEVDTPYIVAIVKGTKFTTNVSDAGASVKVSEGVVGVSAAAGGSSIDLTAGGSASVSAAHSDTVTPGGPTGDAAPAGNHGKESTLASSGDPSSGGDAGAGAVSGGSLSGGADDDSIGSSAAARGGRGGNGGGRDDRESSDNNLIAGNGDGQGGVDSGGDGDNGGGCHGHGHGHRHHRGDEHDDDHGHGGHRH